MNNFKVFSICLIKNEADVIGHCLTEASKWSDKIFVYDNGSTDGTWEIVLGMKNEIITPWRQDNRAYQDSLRGDVFRDQRHLAKNGDWWCKLDADEFFVPNPREFLSTVPKRYHVVWAASLEYYLTLGDVDKIDFHQPIDHVLNRLVYYRSNVGEQRFFRHRDRLDWPATSSWPLHMGRVSPERIPVRHYKYRSPAQMQQRIDTRLDAVKRGYPGWWASYNDNNSWKSLLADPDKCYRDLKDGHLQIDDISAETYRGKLTHRMIKGFMHSLHLWP